MLVSNTKTLKAQLKALTKFFGTGWKELFSEEEHVSYDAWIELLELIAQRKNAVYKIQALKVAGLRWSLLPFLKPKRKYAPIFDERIYTEKLLGKPSPGLPPPYIR